jgi:hypothetical protein
MNSNINIFFWALSKKIKFLFDFTKNDYAIVNSIYLCLSFFYSIMIGKFSHLTTTEPFAVIMSIGIYGFYGLITLTNKDFKSQIMNRFYPISRFKQYGIDFFLSFFDLYFILFSSFGLGLIFSTDNFLITDFLSFLIGLVSTYATLNILLAFNNDNTLLFFAKILIFVLNFFCICLTIKYPQYWVASLTILALTNFFIGYLFFLHDYNTSPQQKNTEKRTIAYQKPKHLSYFKILYYCRIPRNKMLGSLFWKLTILIACSNLLEWKLEANSFEFTLFVPVLFSPYFHLPYFANIWGINKDSWLIINLSANYKRQMLLFFLVHLLFFVLVDFLFFSILFFYFSIGDTTTIIFYMLSVLVFAPISFICSILFPMKISKKMFYDQEASNSTMLVAFILYCQYGVSLLMNFYFTVIFFIICSAISVIFLTKIYNNYDKHRYKHKIYHLFFK